MSDVDLSQFSAEELQAALEKKKAEETKKATEEYASLGIDFDNPKQGDLVKWVNSQYCDNPFLSLARGVNNNTDGRLCSRFPGKLTSFVTMSDEDHKPTTDKSKCKYIHIWDVDIATKSVLDIQWFWTTDNCFDKIVEKI